MEKLYILDEFEGESTRELASIGFRFGALVIDGVVLFFMSMLAFIAIYFWLTLLGLNSDTDAIDNLVSLALTLAYFGFQEGNNGTTIGKRAVGIKVVQENGEPMSLSKGFLRAFGRFLSGLILLIGYFLAFFNKENKTLHDMIASTLVVKA